MTLDEWTEANATDLYDSISTHLQAMTDLPADERADLLRVIFISIRQWKESK